MATKSRSRYSYPSRKEPNERQNEENVDLELTPIGCIRKAQGQMGHLLGTVRKFH